jgi:hypothetical protein
MGNGQKVKSLLCLFLAIIFLQLLAGCYSTLTLSDEDAVKLLKNYYSFYEQKGVDAEIIKRGEFIKECNCYPIEFHVIHLENGTYDRTFYFYKNGNGTPEIKKFKYGVKYSS